MKTDMTILVERGIHIVLAIIIFFLVSRFFFQFAGADPTIPFAANVYSISALFLSPFYTHEALQSVSDSSVLDVTTLVIAFFYTIISQVITAVFEILHSYRVHRHDRVISLEEFGK